jgi:uncharacterized protein YdeI (YjbR/CyaY-like superfamily)
MRCKVSSLSSEPSEDRPMKPAGPQAEVLRPATKWLGEFEALRAIILTFPLTEEMKWYQPCYTLQGKNVVLFHGFKEYCALLFFKGALLSDPNRILVTPGEHQAARQIRFTSAREIVRMKATLKAYLQEAIEAEQAGLKVKLKKTSDYKIPEEFQERLNENPALKSAFRALTPGRQRGYVFHFSRPKQAKTREARVAKCLARILNGKGLDDK